MANNLKLAPKITQAGINLAVMRNNQSISLNITHISIGTSKFNPTGRETAIPNEVLRTPIESATKLSHKSFQIRGRFQAPANQTITAFSIGFWDNTTLLAVYSSNELSDTGIFSVHDKVETLISYVLNLEALRAENITVIIDQDLDRISRILEERDKKILPKTLTATTRNSVDNTGHSHEIAQGGTTQKGIVQLTNDTGLDSETLGLSAKGGKAIAQSVAQLQQAMNNGLNQKVNKSDVSSSVSSTSTTTVANSQAVKTAYDKGVEAKTAADNAQRAANAAQTTANNAQTSADNAQRTAESKAPASHTHPMGNIVGLETALAGKVSKSGDEMSGTLWLNNTEPRIHGKKENTHQWYIGSPSANTDNVRLHSYKHTTYLELERDNVSINKELNINGNPAHHSGKAYVSVNVSDRGYGGLDIQRTGVGGSWVSRVEALPDKRWKFYTQNGYEQYIPARSGTIVLDSDPIFSLKAGKHNQGIASLNGVQFLSFNNDETARSNGLPTGLDYTGLQISDDRWQKTQIISGGVMKHYIRTDDEMNGNWVTERILTEQDVIYQKIGNFEIRKYPDGTMIQTNFIAFTTKNHYRHEYIYSFNWAVAFVEQPRVFANAAMNTPNSRLVDRFATGVHSESSGAKHSFYLYDPGGEQGDWEMHFLAIGRWK